MLCKVCNEDIFDDDIITCSNCNEHYHFMCATLKETTFRKMSKVTKSKWACYTCKFNDINKSPTQVNTTQINNPVPNNTNENYQNLTESVNYMSEKFDTFGKQIQEVLSTIKEMRKEKKILKEQNNKLNNEINLLGNRVNILEQKEFNNFVEFIGVPEINDENCFETVKIITGKLGVDTSIKKAFRVPSKIKHKPRKLVAELNTNQCCNNIIINSRKQKPRGNMFHDNWGMEAIYVNNYLTFFNRNLLYKTKAFARELGFKFVWFRESKIFMKKNEDHKAIIIENEFSLSNLK